MRELRKTSNPALKTKAFRNATAVAGGEVMTVNGTIGKSFILLVLVLVTAGWCWSRFYTTGSVEAVAPFMMGGVIGGLVFGFATIFKPTWAHITAPLYALAEGLFVGGISALFELKYPGVVVQAVALTLAVAFGMLIMYRTGIIKVTDRLRRMIIAATFGVMIFYFLTMLVGFFGVNTSMMFGHSSLSIGISLFIVAIAAFNLVLDFDMISQQARAGAPRYMEWYGGFALMVTLIWLYLEILRLLGNSRR